MICDEHIERHFLRFQFESQLLIKRGKSVEPDEPGSLRPSAAGRPGNTISTANSRFEIELPGEPCMIQHVNG